MAISNSGLLLGVALALTITAAPAAETDFNSANYILPGCKEVARRGPVSAGQALCLGTVRGIAFMGWLAKHDHAEYSCMDIPDEVPVLQAVAVVVTYIEARPARWHEPFNQLAFEALRIAWPCR
jgi:hypothetical protein